MGLKTPKRSVQERLMAYADNCLTMMVTMMSLVSSMSTSVMSSVVPSMATSVMPSIVSPMASSIMSSVVSAMSTAISTISVVTTAVMLRISYWQRVRRHHGQSCQDG